MIDGPLLHLSPKLSSPGPPSIRYPIPSREAGNALVPPSGLRVSMGGDDHLLYDGSPVYLPLEHAIKNDNILNFLAVAIVENEIMTNSGPATVF
ncbi:hypothetical protein EVAR_857_1 [Eumeta japonica]|uniref:Uncharacterized protein n=1 Tax=Eumeta variegata TaxID=151549 RepID=A0A4C1SEE0_EUMVA|nr:hypothetical protein EVAR_857_1 [Eumeta japonica]